MFPVPTSDHNETLAGDTLTSVSFNYEWRKIIADAIDLHLQKIASTIAHETDRQEFEERCGNLLIDFYNSEAIVTEAVGSIKLWGSADIPTGWMHCDGQALSESTYPDLFAVIGHNFGGGSGLFLLPNTGYKFILGSDGGDFADIGDFGGEIEHTLTVNEIPAHSHTQRVHNNQPGGGSIHLERVSKNSAVVTNAVSSTADAGGGAAHNNMPPYTTLAYIIKVVP